MPRPRVHDRDTVLDAAESLAVETGPAGVTTRAVAAAAGVSNGAIYHSFRSRGDLVAQTWLRAARGLPRRPERTGRRGARPAGRRPRRRRRRGGRRTRRLLSVATRSRRACCCGSTAINCSATTCPTSVAADLADLDRALIGLMVRLSLHLWDRRDAAAVDAITLCIVDLPTAIPAVPQQNQ